MHKQIFIYPQNRNTIEHFKNISDIQPHEWISQTLCFTQEGMHKKVYDSTFIKI